MRFSEDLAFDRSMADGKYVAVVGGGEDAMVARRALGEGDSGEERYEVEVVALVGGEWMCGIFRRVEVIVQSEAGGADAGRSVEGVYFEAGVVGDYDLVG